MSKLHKIGRESCVPMSVSSGVQAAQVFGKLVLFLFGRAKCCKRWIVDS